MRETFFYFSLIHLWWFILIQKYAGCHRTCSTFFAVQCQRPLGRTCPCLQCWLFEICGKLRSRTCVGFCCRFGAFHSCQHIVDSSCPRNRRWVMRRWSLHPKWWVKVKGWFLVLTFLSLGAKEMGGSFCSQQRVSQASVLQKRAAATKSRLRAFTKRLFRVSCTVGCWVPVSLELYIISRWLCCKFINLVD